MPEPRRTVATLTAVPMPGNTLHPLPRSLSARAPGVDSRLPNQRPVGVISHLGPVRELGGACGRLRPRVYRGLASRRDRSRGAPCSAARCSSVTRRRTTRTPSSRSGPPRGGRSPDAEARRARRPVPRWPGSPPTPTSGCSSRVLDGRGRRAVHLAARRSRRSTRDPAVYVAAPPGARRVPPPRHRPCADGGDRELGRGEGLRARRRRRVGLASRDANRFMARLGLGQVAVMRGATVPALRAKLPRRASGRGAGGQPQPPQRRPGARPATLDAARPGQAPS